MIDLHLHLDGSLSIDDMLTLAKMNHVDENTILKEKIHADEEIKNLDDYLSRFELPLSLLQNAASITFATYSLFKRLSEQGLIYAEVRLAPSLMTRNGLSQHQVVAASIKGLEMAKDETLMPGQLILSCMRCVDLATNLETIDVAKYFFKKGVCGVDLAGSESSFDTSLFKKVFEKANQYDLSITIHAGEASGPSSVWDAIKMGARRIGHGVRSIEDPMLMEFLATTKIPLELCPTSEVDTHAIDSYSSLPIRQFMKKGIIVTINTDDMTISNITLEKEYKKLINTFKLSEDEVKTLIKNSIKASFLEEDQKDYLLEILEKKYGQQRNE